MTTPSEPTPTENSFLVLPPNPRDVCTCEHPRSTHGEQREGPYCWGVLRIEEPVCECPGFAFKRLTRLEQIRWEHERAAHWDPLFHATTETGVLLAEIDRLTAELAAGAHRLKVAERGRRATVAGCCVMLGLPKGTAEPDVFEAIRKLAVEVAHRRQQNRELAAMEENARKQHRALSDRISDMANCWEQQLADTIRTAAVVSALRAAVERHR